jgi:tetratricopeptide (TPR) repeat protein
VASAGVGHVLLRRGDWRGAIDVVEPALAIARAPDAALWFPRIASTLGAAYILAGRPGDAYVLLEEALARTIARELVHQRALITVSLGQAALALGRMQDARKMAEQALRLSRDNEERGHEAWSLCLLGEIASASRADHDHAARLYGEARTLGGTLHMKPVVAHSLLGEGTSSGARALSAQARAPLTTAIAMFREMGMAFWVARAEATLAARN